MQTANVSVALGGDVLNQVPVLGITPAEYLVLASLHGGHDAITSLEIQKPAKGDKAEKLEAKDVIAGLKVKYNSAAGEAVIAKLFTGFNPALPLTFAEVLPKDGEGGAMLVTPPSPDDLGLA